MKLSPTRLHVFDFDDTLVFTPRPEEEIRGLPVMDYYDKWLRESGQPLRKFTGYWGRKETLLPPIFGEWNDDLLVYPEHRLNHDLAEVARESFSRDDTLAVMMTGRHAWMTHEYLGNKGHVVKTVLDHYGLQFDKYHYVCNGMTTVDFKKWFAEDYFKKFPSLREIEIWEDRPEHHAEFLELVNRLKAIGRIDLGLVHLINKKDLREPESNL